MTGSRSGATLAQRWLAEANATLDPRTLAVRTNVAEASRLFSATFHEYENRHGDRIVHSESYSVPRSLQPHVAVLDTHEHQLMRLYSRLERRSSALSLEKREPTAPQSCTGDPGCLRDLYGTSSYAPKVPDRIRVGTANFNGEMTKESDFVTFMRQYRPDAVNVTLPIVPIDKRASQTMPSKGHAEATLDIELLASQVWPIKPIMYFAHGQPPVQSGASKLGRENEPFLHLFDYLLHLEDDALPSVLSISYADFEHTVPRKYAERVCQYAAVLGMRGMTIVASSGDEGLGSLHHDGCKIHGHRKFMPIFPASCPYVTAVGGTDGMIDEAVGKIPGKYVSGAGFSNLFSRPAWQDGVVQPYLDNVVKKSFAGLFGAGGRAYPDVAVRSVSFTEVLHGHNMTSSGTSGSAPLFASMVALFNDARVAAGQPLLGFLNPLLYSRLGPVPGGFIDVDDGTITSCGEAGFAAKPGWDVATGYGSPIFPALLPAVMNWTGACPPPPSPPPAP
ncbi:tripeptidyl-peptidase I [Malassezia caprae]|uniref:Tripeptidyl-peptidase I n=1 Tax=Malassezia caprae TaxID=1381934 RepID=A0AAF0IWI5_9BASI|nr:tripeptidyl-peptidase I [Malassezia caprae]